MAIRLPLFLLISAVAMPWAVAEDAPTPAEPGWAIVYIEDLGPTPLRQKLGLEVDTDRQTALPADLDFRCTLLAQTDYDDVNLAMEISPADGPVLFTGDLTLDLAEGAQSALLRWTPEYDIADGDYDVRLTATRPNGHHMASTRLRVRKFSEGQIKAALADASDAVEQLEDHVQALGADSFTPAALQQLAVAGETLELARIAWADANWSEAYDRAKEAAKSAQAIRSGLTFASLAPERFAPGAALDVQQLVIRNGAIVSDGTPVYLYGVRMGLSETDRIAELNTFGLNAVVLELSPADVLPSRHATIDLPSRMDPILDECAAAGIALALQLEPHKIPGWALDQWPDIARTQFPPFHYDVTHPRALDVLETFYRAIGAYIKSEPRILAVSLAAAPRFRISDEPMRQGFAAYLAQVYPTKVELNLAWRTRLTAIEDVPIRWDWDKPAYQAHLQRYHRDQVTGFFSWMVDKFGPDAAELPLMFTAPQSTFALASAKDGIDMEALNRGFVASGVETITEAPPSPYALPFPDTQMQYTLMRSLNPDRPVFNFNAVVGEPRPVAAPQDAYPFAERARLWTAAIDGADLSVASVDALFDSGEGFRPHDTRDLAAFISGGQTLNRLAPIVQKFQAQPAPVAIVWSDSSRIFENGSPYLPSLRRAYEGVASFGLPIRFISERQIAAGGLDSVAIVVLPDVNALADEAFDALDRFLAEGGRMVSTGSSVPYDAYGKSRPSRLQASPLTKLVRGSENPRNYLLALDAAFEASPLDEIPRVINDRRYPILGVISRYYAGDEARYLYVVNLRHEPVMAHLPVGHLEGRDLIEGRPVRFPMELAPLDPMLIELEQWDSAMDAAPEQTPASETPTAIVQPVMQDETTTPSL